MHIYARIVRDNKPLYIMEDIFNIRRDPIITEEDIEGSKPPVAETASEPEADPAVDQEDTQVAEGEDLAVEDQSAEADSGDSEEAPSENNEPEPEPELAVSYRDLAKELAPDADYKSDAEAAEAIKSYIKTTQEERKVTEEQNKIFTEIFENAPDVISLLRMLKEGASFTEALPYIIDPEELKPKEGDPEWANWKKAKDHRDKEKAKQQRKADEIKRNLDDSYKSMDAYFAKRNLPKDVQTKFLTTIDAIVSEISNGMIKEETLERLEKGLIFDTKIQEAATKAEIKGRNDAIKEKIQKEVVPKKGDLLPNIKSASTSSSKETGPPDISTSIDKNIDEFAQALSRF
jgi:hypothetical protein